VDAVIAPARAVDAAAEESVRRIVAQVRERGDEAVVAWSRERDWPEADASSLHVSVAEIEAATEGLAPQDSDALMEAVRRVRAFHERQRPSDALQPDGEGARLGWRYTPIESVGINAPAAAAPLPSSLIMAAAPAQVAGVERIAVVTAPGRDGSVNQGILAAAAILGISEVYRVGGPWAIAALAYGTDAIPRVDKIVGAGNVYVNLAKAMVAGVVGVDAFYGPSEVVILADESADPWLIAADLAAQAEHQVDSVAALVTPSARLVGQIAAALDKTLGELDRAAIARRCLETHGAVIHVRDLAEGVQAVNLLAPEHLELAVAEPEEVMSEIRNAGCILLGAGTPTAVSDYLAGPSHILPTGRSARFSSGLGVMDFLKRSSVVSVSPDWLRRHGASVERLADLEGLQGHGRSVRIRMPKE